MSKKVAKTFQNPEFVAANNYGITQTRPLHHLKDAGDCGPTASRLAATWLHSHSSQDRERQRRKQILTWNLDRS